MKVFSLRQDDVDDFEKALQNKRAEIRITEKEDLPRLLHQDSNLFTVTCEESNCLDITRSCSNDDFSGVFLGFKSVPRRNVLVTISCRDQGRSCNELKRKKKAQKVVSDCEDTVMPGVFSEKKKMALRCAWNKSNKDLELTDCGESSQNLQSEKFDNFKNRCCSQNQTNIFFRKGCLERNTVKTLKPCQHDWSAWSAWSKTVLIRVFTR